MSCLVNLNVPRVRKDSRDFMQMVLFRCLTSMACGSFENWDLNSVEDPMPVRSSVSSKIPRIIHPGALLAVIELLPSLWVVWSEDNEVDKTKEKVCYLLIIEGIYRFYVTHSGQLFDPHTII